MSEYVTANDLPESETVSNASLKSKRSTGLDNLIDQDMIKIDDYRIIKTRKRVGGYVHIKPD